MNRKRMSISFIVASSTIMLAKVIGLVRTMFYSNEFGTGDLASMYAQIFNTYPTLLFTGIGLALSYVNIPHLMEFEHSGKKKQRISYVSNFLTQITLFSSLIVIVGMFFAPVISKLLSPNLSPELVPLSIKMIRIMFTTFIFINLAYIIAGILQVHDKFMISTSTSIPFNIIILISLILFNNDVIMLSFATAIGWSFQFFMQLPFFKRLNYKVFRKPDFSDPIVKENFKQFLPIIVGNSIIQICLIIDRVFAGYVSDGGAAVFDYGSYLFLTATGIFIIAVSTVAFPRLSQHSIEKEYDKIRNVLRYIFKTLFSIIFPYIIITLMFNREIISFIYERGEFDAQSVQQVSVIFLIYSFMAFGYIAYEVFNRLFYSLKKHKVPMVLSICFVSTNFLANLLLFRNGGLASIAITTSALFIIYSVIITILAIREVGQFLTKDLLAYILKLLIPLSAMTLVFFAFKTVNIENKIIKLFAPLSVGGIIYMVIGYFTNFKYILKQKT